MGKSVSVYIDINDRIFRTPNNQVTVQFFDDGTYLTDGTIFGSASISSTGGKIIGEVQPLNVGRYKFSNVISGKYYTVVASGAGINTFIPEGFERYPVCQAPDETGTDIPWKDGETDSLATKIAGIYNGVVSLEEHIINADYTLLKTSAPYQIFKPSTGDFYVLLPTDADLGKTFTIKAKVNGLGVKYNDVLQGTLITDSWVTYIFAGDAWEIINVTPLI